MTYILVFWIYLSGASWTGVALTPSQQVCEQAKAEWLTHMHEQVVRENRLPEPGQETVPYWLEYRATCIPAPTNPASAEK